MKKVSLALLTAITAVVGVVSWIVDAMLIGGGASPFPVPWSVAVVLIVAASAVVSFGWRVREYQQGRAAHLDPFTATRTVMLAHAAAYTGAVLLGVYGAHALALIGDWGHAPRREVIVASILAAVGSAVLAGAGLVVQRWCETGGDSGQSSVDASP